MDTQSYSLRVLVHYVTSSRTACTSRQFPTEKSVSKFVLRCTLSHKRLSDVKSTRMSSPFWRRVFKKKKKSCSPGDVRCHRGARVCGSFLSCRANGNSCSELSSRKLRSSAPRFPRKSPLVANFFSSTTCCYWPCIQITRTYVITDYYYFFLI